MWSDCDFPARVARYLVADKKLFKVASSRVLRKYRHLPIMAAVYRAFAGFSDIFRRREVVRLKTAFSRLFLGRHVAPEEKSGA